MVRPIIKRRKLVTSSKVGARGRRKQFARGSTDFRIRGVTSSRRKVIGSGRRIPIQKPRGQIQEGKIIRKKAKGGVRQVIPPRKIQIQRAKGVVRKVIPPRRISAIPKPKPKQVGVGRSFEGDTPFFRGGQSVVKFIAFSPKPKPTRIFPQRNPNFTTLSQNVVNQRQGLVSVGESRVGEFISDPLGFFGTRFTRGKNRDVFGGLF